MSDKNYNLGLDARNDNDIRMCSISFCVLTTITLKKRKRKELKNQLTKDKIPKHVAFFTTVD